MLSTYTPPLTPSFSTRSKRLPLSSAITRLALFALLVIGFDGVVSPQQRSEANLVAAAYSRPSGTTAAEYPLELRAFELVNLERTRHGLNPLVWTDQAASVARFHSKNMAHLNFFGHQDLDGRRPSKRAEHLGLRDWRQIGENIAWLSGYDDPAQRVVDSWMRSPGHRENILDPSYVETGIGLAVASDRKYYFTQLFVLRR